MLKKPSRQRKKREKVFINLIPIMDGVFIVVFFLLITASTNRSFKIQTDVPVVSKSSEDQDKKELRPLSLTLKVNEESLVLTTGVSLKEKVEVLNLKKGQNGLYDLEKLHQTLIEIKVKNINEQVIIFDVAPGVPYEEIIALMDIVRELRPTDQEIFTKDKNGNDQKIEYLFQDVVFGNLQS